MDGGGVALDKCGSITRVWRQYDRASAGVELGRLDDDAMTMIWRDFEEQGTAHAIDTTTPLEFSLPLGGIVNDGDTLIRSLLFVHAYTNGIDVATNVDIFPAQLTCRFTVGGTAFGTDLVGDAILHESPQWIPHYFQLSGDSFVVYHADWAGYLRDSHAQRIFVTAAEATLFVTFQQGVEPGEDPTVWHWPTVFVNFTWRYLIDHK